MSVPVRKTTSAVTIRASRPQDVAAMCAIYGHHVLHGLASFEVEPPSVEEFAVRRAKIVDKGLPYLSAWIGDALVGYCYAGPYRERPAYRFTLEDSVYVHPDWTGRAVGYQLLSVLIDRCAEAGYRQMVAVIGDSGNHASISVHAKCGFKRAGLLDAVGFKFDRWVDSVLMQRPLGIGAP